MEIFNEFRSFLGKRKESRTKRMAKKREDYLQSLFQVVERNGALWVVTNGSAVRKFQPTDTVQDILKALGDTREVNARYNDGRRLPML